MSAYTTLRITKKRAQQYILSNILSNMNDNVFLEVEMDKILKDRLYNCCIVDDEEPNDNWYL